MHFCADFFDGTCLLSVFPPENVISPCVVFPLPPPISLHHVFFATHVFRADHNFDVIAAVVFLLY